MTTGLRRSIFAVATCCWALSLPVSAGPALVYDATSRLVLFAEHADHPWYPASLAKLMTAYLVFETWKTGKAERTTPITISARANSRPRMRLGLGAGKTITYDEAMAATILHSANDMAVALAEAVAGSEEAFVEQMNATAKRLGMASTRYINANGLPGEGQHSTARDLAILTSAILRDFPEHAGLFATKTAPVGSRTVATHNPVVLRVLGGDGMKTGFTCSAGYNIVASATRDGHRLVAIVLGEPTSAKREARTKALLEQGFRTLDPAPESVPVVLDTLPFEAFDAEQVRALNLAKRFKDCQPREPELDADGKPVCQPAKGQRPGKPGTAANGNTRDKSKAVVCAPAVVAKVKPQPRRAAKVVAKREPAKAAGGKPRRQDG